MNDKHIKRCSVSIICHLSLVQFSPVRFFVTPRTAAHQASLSITNSQGLLKLMSVESVMPSNRLIFCHPIFLPPSIFPSIRVFSKESILLSRWPKYWCFSFSISPSNEYSGLISMGLVGSPCSSKDSQESYNSLRASILWHSAFFMVQLSYPYLTTGKTMLLSHFSRV